VNDGEIGSWFAVSGSRIIGEYVGKLVEEKGIWKCIDQRIMRERAFEREFEIEE